MALTKKEKEEIINKFKIHDTDKGSAQVQIALLTKDILLLTEHSKQNKHDYAGRRGLLAKVARRKALLKYLKNTDVVEYQKTIKAHGLKR